MPIIEDVRMQDTGGAGPTASEQKELVARILASDLFIKSHRLSGFLRFICDQYLRGNAATINEQKIGTEVFGRPPGYHVGEDSIVRSQARFLRQRLEEYFSTEGSHESFVLLIPKGSYIPAFERREPRSTHPAPVPAPASAIAVAPETKTPEPVTTSKPRWLLISAVCALLLLAAAFYLYLSRAHSTGIAAQRISTPEVTAFWSSLFSPDRTTLIVPSDSTLVLMEAVTGKPVHLLSYINKDYLKPDPSSTGFSLWSSLVSSQYTNMADLNLVAHLEQVPQAQTSRVQIRYARDLSLKELKDGNSILIGGRRSNPWLELFSSVAGFDVDYDYGTGHNVVRNPSPAAGEQSLYIENTSGPADSSHAYGVVVYTSSLDSQGHTLLVEGTSKPGTEAAAEFLTSPAFAQFLNKVGATSSTIPNFELLLSTGSMNGASYHPAIVCWHPLRKNNSG
jgi:hypothetical protein